MRSTRLLCLAVLLALTAPAAAHANPFGDLLPISNLAPGSNGSAYDPQVEWNAGTSEYLVAWTANGPFSAGEDEVFVQRLGAAGAQLGGDETISSIGEPGDETREPFGAPGIAADHVNDRTFVVWASDDTAQFEISGQLLDADGDEIGTDDVSVSGSHNGALYPDVAFNPGTAAPGDEEYLVVWTGTTQIDPQQWGRRFDENGAPIGARFQISQIAESGTGSLPRVAYNEDASEYLVVWYSLPAPGADSEAWSQRVDADGTPIGGDVQLTTNGTTTDEAEVSFPAIAYNPLAGDYLLTYQRSERVANATPPPATVVKNEVFSRRLSATGVPQGTAVRLSAPGADASTPEVAYAVAPAAGQYLVTWKQASPPPGLFDGEIWGRRVRFDNVTLADAFALFVADQAFTLDPAVAARSDALEWLVVWDSRCPAGAGTNLEVLGRRVDTGSSPTGDGVCRVPSRPGPGPGTTPAPTPTPTPATPSTTVPPTVPPAPPRRPAALAALKAAQVLSLPSARRCVSRRRFRIRLKAPSGVKLARAVVTVNGKRVRTVTGRRLTAPVDLRGLPRGRFTVKVEATAADGRKVSQTRRYRTCASRRR